MGTLFAAMLVRARSRDVMLPDPAVPDHHSGHHRRACAAPPRCSSPTPDESVAQMWIALLAFFDIVFVTLSLWTFEPLMTE